MTATADNPILSTAMRRSGYRSHRELAEMTGIAPRTMDRIMRDPSIARGWQMREIADALGLSDEMTGKIVRGK